MQLACTDAIGVDVGGTWTRVGLVRDSRLIRSQRDRTFTGDAESFCARLADTLDAFKGCKSTENFAPRHASGTTPIGIALPGLVDPQQGVLRRSVNLAQLQGFPLLSRIQERTGTPVALLSDADAATWSEYQAVRPVSECFIHLRLGTGAACGIIRHGELQPLDPDRTTHWPGLIADRSPNAPLCACGLRGCLETIASGRALQARISQCKWPTLVDLQTKFAAGNETAMRIVREAAAATNYVIQNLVNLYSPNAIALGGGVIDALPSMFESVLAFGERNNMPVIRKGALGDEAGIIGAAEFASARASTHVTDSLTAPGRHTASL